MNQRLSKKLLALVCAIAMLLSVCAVSGFAEESAFAGGSGTAEDPYQIATAEQLAAVAENLAACYVLKADIDLSGYESWEPIGTATYDEMAVMNVPHAFRGSFDGTKAVDADGNVTETYKISGVTIDKSSDASAVVVGLFGLTTGEGVISNLTLENVTVTGGESAMAVGGLIGYGMSAGGVKNVTLTGENTITGTNCVGGIVGGDGTNVIDCTVENTTINIFGDNTVGDNSFLSGRLVQHDVAECGGAVVGGGFGATVRGCTVKNCIINANTASGAVEAVGLGGIGGCLQCMTEIKDNHVDGLTINAAGGHAIGGLCGYAGNGNMAAYYGTDCTISDCTVAGLIINAEGATHVGGLIGTNMYYMGMEGQFEVTGGCAVSGTITAGTDSTSLYGKSVPGAIAGRAAGCVIAADACDFSGLTINGADAADVIGVTSCMYESADQDDSLNQTDAGAQLNALFGTYQPLFEGATFDEKCDSYWHDAAAAVVGESMADDAVALMKASIGGNIYGQEAADAYAVAPESMAFFCGFPGGMATLTVNGTQITGFDASGEELFSHAYQCIGSYNIGEEIGLTGFGGYAFQSLDADAGELTYFLFLPDTTGSTYHIEFRHGSSLEEMQLYGSGAYAYWLAAGVSTEAMNQSSDNAAENDAILRNVIGLFCAENLSEMTTDETASQRAALVGTWDASEETLKILRADSGVADAQMYCVLGADGTGATYVDMAGTGEFVMTDSYTFYAYDNDENADTQSGVYIAVPAESAQTVLYDLAEQNGKTTLSLHAADGTASWVLRAE